MLTTIIKSNKCTIAMAERSSRAIPGHGMLSLTLTSVHSSLFARWLRSLFFVVLTHSVLWYIDVFWAVCFRILFWHFVVHFIVGRRRWSPSTTRQLFNIFILMSSSPSEHFYFLFAFSLTMPAVLNWIFKKNSSSDRPMVIVTMATAVCAKWEV